jgi:long-chain fatty acid transport protein
VLLAVIFYAPSLSAGGLYIREFGQPAQGTAGAGGGVLLADASTAFTNPAGLFWLEQDSEWLVTGLVVSTSVEFDPDEGTTIPGNDGGDGGGNAFGGALFHTRKLSDRWGISFALNSFSGSALDHDFGYVGRYEVQDVDLLTISATPSIAYRINDNLAVSASAVVLYGRMDYTAAIPPLLGPPTPDRDGTAEIEDGDDYSITPALSLLWQPTQRLDLALGYIGKNELDFEGDLSITLPGAGGGATLGDIDAELGLTLAEVVRVAAGYAVSPQLSLFGSIAWENWSEFDSAPLTTDAGAGAIPINWDDTWNFAVGFRWRTLTRWAWYGGISYDTDPTDPQDRLAVLPADEQWRLAAGIRYALADDRQVGATLTYVDLGDARLETQNAGGSLVGEFDTNRAVFLAVNFAW